MKRPKLQIACDHTNLKKAISDIVLIGNEVDIIEIGTILLINEGTKAISYIRELFPKKKIIADTKCVDAGQLLGNSCARAGADIMTCTCNASILTMQAASKELSEIQIELFGSWTSDDEKLWLESGFNKVIYHQSREKKITDTWSKNDITKVQELVNRGFDVSITGGLNAGNLELFSGIELDSIIVGRGITESNNPKQATIDLKKEIVKVW